MSLREVESAKRNVKEKLNGSVACLRQNDTERGQVKHLPTRLCGILLNGI